MSEEQDKQESQKTLVAFVAGLLIGGLLVWVFGGSPQNTDQANTESNDETPITETTESDTGVISTTNNTDDNNDDAEEDSAPQMQTGDGEVEVSNQPAGSVVTLERATFPTSEGWVGVRTFPNGQIGSILGAARYSEEQGLIPTEVPLLVPTVAGRTYAVTFFTEDGDKAFNPAYDVQIDTAISTFVAE